jgi:predicted DNA-binding protein with PD1-like motif
MQSTTSHQRHFLVLDRGEEIIASITKYAEDHSIHAGSIMGIGAATDVTLRYYDLASRAYKDRIFAEDYEILSLSGNISLLKGKPFTHIHIALGKSDFGVIGGHLGSATVAVTCEVILDASDAFIERQFDDRIGLSLWKCGIQ